MIDGGIDIKVSVQSAQIGTPFVVSVLAHLPEQYGQFNLFATHHMLSVCIHLINILELTGFIGITTLIHAFMLRFWTVCY